MPTWMLVVVVAAAGLVGAGIGGGATAYFVERGPVGETGPQGDAGPRGPRGPSADDLSTEVADLAGRVDDVQVAVEDGIPPLVAEDISTLADQIEETQQMAVDNCGAVGRPIYECNLGGFSLNSGP